MAIFKRKERPQEARAFDSFFDWQNQVPTRPTYGTIAGPPVTMSNTLGLATAAAAVKLVSGTIGTMPLKVYRGEPPEREPARDSWQWFRLKEAPSDDQDAFTFWQDAAGSIETYGNAFIWKAIGRRPVRDEGDIELFLLDPERVVIKREDGRKVYEVWRNGQRERVSPSQILHIRGWTLTPGSDLGVSPITLHRETLGAALASQEYQSRFFSNGTALPGFIVLPAGGNPNQGELDRFQLEWQQRHAGVANAGRPGILANGATWVPTGISMRDAQFIETQGFSAEEVARIFGIHPPMLGLQLDKSKSVDEDFDRFMQADMGPRIRRIEAALARDRDLFPTDSDLFPEFLTSAVMRPSLRTRNASYKDSLQAGWQTANEVRELENLPPMDFGDALQQTPVGGAPNPSVTNTGE